MAISIIQKSGAHSASGTVQVTLNSVVAGSAIIVCAYSFLDTDYTLASDNGGALTKDVNYYQPGNYVSSMWSLLNVASGSHVITLSGGATNSLIQAWEIGGLPTSGAFHTSNTYTSAGVESTIALSDVTTTEASCLIIGFIHATNVGSYTAGGSFGSDFIETNDATFGRDMASEAKVVSSTGTYTANFASANSVAHDGIVAAYKAASGGTDIPVAGGSVTIAGLVAGMNYSINMPDEL